MAGAANLKINVQSRGADKARQDIASVAATVDRQAEKLNKRQDKREKGRFQSFREGIGKGAFGRIGATAIGTAIGQVLPQTIGAFNRGIAQAFDPNLSPVEKELNLAKAGLDLIPFEGGAIPKALLEAQTQEVVGAARGTGARINQLLGPAFRGAAGLSDEQFAERFTPTIERLQGFIEPQERARERGSQLIAENLTSFLDEFKDILRGSEAGGALDAEAARLKAQEDLRKALENLTNAITSPTSGGINFADIRTVITGKVD